MQHLTSILQKAQSTGRQLFGNTWREKGDWQQKIAVHQFLIKVHKGIKDGAIPHSFLNYLQNGNPVLALQYHQQLLQMLQLQGSTIQAIVEALQLNEGKIFSGSTLLHQPFLQQEELLQQWASRTPEIHHIIAWNNAKDSARTLNVEPLIEVAATWPLAESHVDNSLKKKLV